MPKKPKTPASESHGARLARGRVPTMVSLSTEAKARLDALAERLGWTKSQVVEEALVRMERDETAE